MADKEFKVNEYITLKLEGNKTIIYVEEKKFQQCKFLLLNIPVENITSLGKIESVDEASEILSKSLERGGGRVDIPPEVAFWGHCSNLQAWVENEYDTRLLHSNLAFPLLERLSETGDQIAKKIFKEEIAKRFTSGYIPVMLFLLEEYGYLIRVLKEEVNVSFENIDYESIAKLNHKLCFSLLKELIIMGDPIAKNVIKDEIAEKFSNGDTSAIKYLVDNRYLEEFNHKDFQTLFSGYEFVEYNEKKILVVNGCLDLRYRGITDLDEVKGLKSLNSVQTLFLDFNSLLSLPESIGNLTSLQKLSLSFNRLDFKNLRKLPESIGNLTSLKALHLNNNDLATLPESIGNLSSLQILDLSRNKFTILPESICTLISLQKLDLGGNSLKKLPKAIGNLTSLQELCLIGTKVTTLPESIHNLTSLQVLTIGFSNLTALPESICTLTSLQRLNLMDNKLTTLPEWIDTITSLQELNLEKNALKKLPNSIGSLTLLQVLYLGHNQLTTLPKSIGNLTSLQTLRLNNNEITTLPESIGDLTSLQILDLDSNELIALPESITNLNSLQKLDLRRNPLNTDPDLLEKLKENGVLILKYPKNSAISNN